MFELQKDSNNRGANQKRVDCISLGLSFFYFEEENYALNVMFGVKPCLFIYGTFFVN